MEQSEQTGTIGAKPEIVGAVPPSQPKSRKKTALMVFIVILLLGLVGGALRAICCTIYNENTSKDNCGQAGDDGDASLSTKPEEPTNEIIELSVDDELVQKLYRSFDHVSFPDANRFSFYIDKNSMAGNPNRDLMLTIARHNTVTRFCKGDHYDQGGIRWSECYSGSEIAQKVEEIFGKKLEFTEDDIIEGRGCFGWYYDPVNDEFHQNGSGCGSADPRRVSRKLYAAAKDADHVYLYELAIFTEMMLAYHIGEETMAGDPIGELSDLGITLNMEGAVLQGDVEYYKELLSQDKFKWTFVWNGENYIFEKLERI